MTRLATAATLAYTGESKDAHTPDEDGSTKGNPDSLGTKQFARTVNGHHGRYVHILIVLWSTRRKDDMQGPNPLFATRPN